MLHFLFLCWYFYLDTNCCICALWWLQLKSVSVITIVMSLKLLCCIGPAGSLYSKIIAAIAIIFQKWNHYTNVRNIKFLSGTIIIFAQNHNDGYIITLSTLCLFLLTSYPCTNFFVSAIWYDELCFLLSCYNVIIVKCCWNIHAILNHNDDYLKL